MQLFQVSAGEGPSHFTAITFAEMLPRSENRVTLDPKQRDAWGIPVLRIECSHGQEELERARDQSAALRELAEVAGVTLTADQRGAGGAGQRQPRMRHRADG